MFTRVTGWLRVSGRWLAQVLEGEHRVAHGWGLFPLGVGVAVALFLTHTTATAAIPHPVDPWWRLPGIGLSLFVAFIGLFLLVAPHVRAVVVNAGGPRAIVGRIPVRLQSPVRRMRHVSHAHPSPTRPTEDGPSEPIDPDELKEFRKDAVRASRVSDFISRSKKEAKKAQDDQIDAVLDAEQDTRHRTDPLSRPVPDFSAEIRRFHNIDTRYDGSKAWDAMIDQWIDDVYAKLAAWNERNAERFLNPPPAASIGFRVSGVLSGRTDLNQYPNLRNLHVFRDQLRDIIGQ